MRYGAQYISQNKFKIAYCFSKNLITAAKVNRMVNKLINCSPKSHSPLRETMLGNKNGTTKVSMTIKQKSLAGLKKMIEMDFKRGFTMRLNYLENLLKTLS